MGERDARERERGSEVGVFHWDLGIKYLHDSSFASVYTAKLANPKYSAFTSTRRRKTGTRQERMEGGWSEGSVRVTGLWLYANTARGLICRLRTFGADSKIASPARLC